MNDKFEKLSYWGKAIDVAFVFILAQMLRFSWGYFFTFLVAGGLQYLRKYLYEMQVRITMQDLKENLENLEIYEKVNTKQD